MKYCYNCGKEVADGAKFCGSCGVAAEGAPTPAPIGANIPQKRPAGKKANVAGIVVGITAGFVALIIIILASLAIPRFMEASASAKMAEAPRVLKSFESAHLVALAEKDGLYFTESDLAFQVPDDSKFFTYKIVKDPQGHPVACHAESKKNYRQILWNADCGVRRRI